MSQANSSGIKLHDGIYYSDSPSFLIGDSSELFSFNEFYRDQNYLLSISLSSAAIQSGVRFRLEETSGLNAATGYNLEGQQTSLGATGSLASIQFALDKLRVETNGSRSQFNVDINISEQDEKIFFNPGVVSRNYYEYVESNQISWHDAKAAAENKRLYNQPGHLATIRSKEENDFIAEKTTAENIWIGATDEDVEGDWKWSGGPDDDIMFWQGEKSDSDKSVNGEFENWNRQEEPNNHNENEHYAVTNWNNAPGKWNDLKAGNIAKVKGYIVEYEQPKDGWPGDQQIKLKQQTPSNFTVKGFEAVNLFGDQTGRGTIEATDPEGLTQGQLVRIIEEPEFGTLSFNDLTNEWNYIYSGENVSDDLPGNDSFRVSLTDDAGFITQEVIDIKFERMIDDRFEGGSSIDVTENFENQGSIDYSKGSDDGEDDAGGKNLEVNAVLNVIKDNEDEDSADILFGPSTDLLENKCVLNVSDGLIDMGDKNDTLITNTYISTNELRGGEGFDHLILTDDVCESITGKNLNQVKSMLIDGFEKITVRGGQWQFEGDHSESKIHLGSESSDSGILEIPLKERSSYGLRAKKVTYKGGTVNVMLDLADVSDPTQGRWRVLNGLSRSSFNSVDPDDVFSLDIIGGDSNFEPKWDKRGSRLFLRLDESSSLNA